MSIFCDLAGHRASAQTIRNGGHHFARCTRCNADLVEHDGAWTAAPKGFRIVWKPAGAEPLELTEVALATEVAPKPVVEAEPLGLAEVAAAIEEAPKPVVEERRGGDRRAPPGTQPKFTGVDRRRGDRRASFGKKPFDPRANRPLPAAEA